MDKIQAMLELERRGKLPEQFVPLLAEARNRGLIPGGAEPEPAQAKAQAQAGPSFSDYAEQAGAGSQEGIAQMLGFPVDAVSSALSGVGQMTGAWGPIENPVLGSEWIDKNFGMQKLRQNVPEPSTDGLKFTRRVGEEIGASTVGLPAVLATKVGRAAPGAATLVEGLSALGSGTGAAAAEKYAPDSLTAEIIASLIGGIGGGKIGAKATGLGGKPAVVRDGTTEQKQIADEAYARVRADQTPLPQGSADNLKTSVQQRMAQERINPRLHGNVNDTLEAIVDDIDSGKVVRAEDVENLRRLPEENIPFTAKPSEKRLAAILKDEITSYLDGTGMESADDLRIGRDAHRRALASEGIDDARKKAQRSAARTGSGGNEINATRQKLSSILDSPRKRRSFKPEELDLMEKVVLGEVPVNALRRLSRFAPTSGGLSALLGIGGTMASPEIALPIMAATELAKAGGERLTRNSIDAIANSIAPSRVTSTSQQGVDPIVRAMLQARVISGAE